MKKNLPESQISEGHSDYFLLSALAADITARAGGSAQLSEDFAEMLRVSIDDVILTPKTGRRSYEVLEKTEKSYIGTRVEIELRALLRLPKGRLDTVILGHDVDIKNTMGSNWMIPTEAVDSVCLLVAADEARALCYLGLIVARRDNLTDGQNKDSKRTVTAAGFCNILWLLRDHPYPANFWRTVTADSVDRIFAGRSGNLRVMTLFREVQRRPIGRDVIEAVAQQIDFMRRIRSDNGHGARDHLAHAGVLLLSGQYDAGLIDALSLPECSPREFISCTPTTDEEFDLAKRAGMPLPRQLAL